MNHEEDTFYVILMKCLFLKGICITQRSDMTLNFYLETLTNRYFVGVLYGKQDQFEDYFNKMYNMTLIFDLEM